MLSISLNSLLMEVLTTDSGDTKQTPHSTPLRRLKLESETSCDNLV